MSTFKKNNGGTGKVTPDDIPEPLFENEFEALGSLGADDLLDENEDTEEGISLSQSDEDIAEENAAQKKAQREHDDLVEDTFGEEEQEPITLQGVDLEPISLTTIKFLRKVNSSLIEGKLPEDDEDMQREIGYYLIFHSPINTIKERAQIARLKGEALEDELDEFMHNIHLENLHEVFGAMAGMLARETRTLAVPVKNDDEDDGGAGKN